MFLAALNWMLAHVPGFMRPGVNWLVDGLRRITGHIAGRWNALGRAAGTILTALIAMRGHLANFNQTVVNAVWWLKIVYVPRIVNTAMDGLRRAVNTLVSSTRDAVMRVVSGLERWARQQIDRLGVLLDNVIRWARERLAKIDAFVDRLISGLRHVLSGPATLAAWLAGEMWKALARYAFSQRDRIARWWLRESIVFTRWLASSIEDVIVRLL